MNNERDIGQVSKQWKFYDRVSLNTNYKLNLPRGYTINNSPRLEPNLAFY